LDLKVPPRPLFNMKIILGGIPGSGKGTIAKLLAKKYNLKTYSIGSIRRDIAKSKKLTIEQLNNQDENQSNYNKTSDKLVDDFQKNLNKEDNFVIDGRLSAIFILNADLKVYLDANLDERAKRILQHKRQEESFSSSKETKKKIIQREASDAKRYEKLHKIKNYTNKKYYDLVINTTNKTPEEIVKIIEKNIQKNYPLKPSQLSSIRNTSKKFFNNIFFIRTGS